MNEVDAPNVIGVFGSQTELERLAINPVDQL